MGDELQPLAATTLIIVDGNALFHGMTEIPDTFRGVSEKLFSMLPSTSDVVFSTYSYSDISIKSIERTRRGNGERYLVKGANMKRPPDWKGFLGNNDNKEILAELILDVWSEDYFAPKLHNRKVIQIIY